MFLLIFLVIGYYIADFPSMLRHRWVRIVFLFGFIIGVFCFTGFNYAVWIAYSDLLCAACSYFTYITYIHTHMYIHRTYGWTAAAHRAAGILVSAAAGSGRHGGAVLGSRGGAATGDDGVDGRRSGLGRSGRPSSLFVCHCYSAPCLLFLPCQAWG